MARELTLAGLRISGRDWDTMDERSRLQYLQVFIETTPPRADGWAYEAYELSINLPL